MLFNNQNGYCAPDGALYHAEPSNGACGSLASTAKCAFRLPGGGCNRSDHSEAPCVSHARDDAACIVWIRDTPPEAPEVEPNPL